MSTFSPLQEVEWAVQERAKAVSLDLGSPEAAVRMRALVGEEVARWSDDFKRSFDIANRSGWPNGPTEMWPATAPLSRFLADDDVWEIMVVGGVDLRVCA